MAYESELLHELEDEYSGEGEDEWEGESEGESSLEGEGWLGAIGNVVGSLLGEGEDEYEAEDEISPVRKIYPDAMMEHLGELAFEAETEDEAAEHFLPLIGMAASKLLPSCRQSRDAGSQESASAYCPGGYKSHSSLITGNRDGRKTLHRNPQTRHLVKVVPAITRRTVGTIARQAAQAGTSLQARP